MNKRAQIDHDQIYAETIGRLTHDFMRGVFAPRRDRRSLKPAERRDNFDIARLDAADRKRSRKNLMRRRHWRGERLPA